jgi:hypothetical protein
MVKHRVGNLTLLATARLSQFPIHLETRDTSQTRYRVHQEQTAIHDTGYQPLPTVDALL